MDTLERVINAVKNRYLDAADLVSDHPHWTIWGAAALVLFFAVR